MKREQRVSPQQVAREWCNKGEDPGGFERRYVNNSIGRFCVLHKCYICPVSQIDLCNFCQPRGPIFKLDKNILFVFILKDMDVYFSTSCFLELNLVYFSTY